MRGRPCGGGHGGGHAGEAMGEGGGKLSYISLPYTTV